ncbi:putative F-box protein At3g10240 [Aristolochia californica]|uniref:putative F-box protein At3g10240 n=1 Tax=Aristolochia californica TaxID=171875 RepID=UPI0035E0C869
MEKLPSGETEKEEEEATGAASGCPRIPDEMVFEILSWLPVRDVIRFTTICKLWRSITSESVFLKIHTNRAPSLLPVVILGFEEWGPGRYIHAGTSNGLLCYQNQEKSFIITNPAIRKSRPLPPVHDPSHTPTFCYIPSTGEYKIANFFYCQKKYFCEVITVGDTEMPFQPKEIEVPSTLKFILHQRFSLKTGTMTHFIRTLYSSIEIATFDLETEVFRSKSLPLSRFNVKSLQHKFVWDDCLCLATIVKNKLMAFVLEDYERDEWRKHEVVLPIKSEEIEEPISPLLSDENKLWFRVGKTKVVMYDYRNGQMETTTYDCTVVFTVEPGWKRTLVACEGMT